jgi:hypothetical protein
MAREREITEADVGSSQPRRSVMVTLSGVRRYALVTFLGAAAVAGINGQGGPLAAGESLLGGKVVSSAGTPLAGVPVRARRENGTITANVFTNTRGEYAFPGWAELTPGSYAVAIDLPDFERATQTATLTAGQIRRVDFALRPRQPTLADATAAEIVAALPGTDEQKHLVMTWRRTGRAAPS